MISLARNDEPCKQDVEWIDGDELTWPSRNLGHDMRRGNRAKVEETYAFIALNRCFPSIHIRTFLPSRCGSSRSFYPAGAQCVSNQKEGGSWCDAQREVEGRNGS
jgi:hypothetical protein